MSDSSRRLHIDLADLADAFESGLDEMTYYLDLETASVTFVSDETRSLLEEIYEQAEGGRTAPERIDELLAEADLPKWEWEAILEADQVEAGFGTRFIKVPRLESHEGYQDMVDFTETVNDPHLAEKLSIAIDGRGAFRRFKDVLLDYLDERERWFTFKADRMK